MSSGEFPIVRDGDRVAAALEAMHTLLVTCAELEGAALYPGWRGLLEHARAFAAGASLYHPEHFPLCRAITAAANTMEERLPPEPEPELPDPLPPAP